MKHVCVLCCCLICALACKKDSPVKVPETVTSRRDYAWSVDTLWLPGANQIVARDIWGSSSTDVWVATWSGANSGSLWYYDGVRWANPASPADANDGRGAVDLSGVYGISSRSIWFVGSRIRSHGPGQTETVGFIMEWNGTAFVERTDSIILNGPELVCIWGRDRNSLFAGGLDGQILRFDGTQWLRISNGDHVWLNSVWGTLTSEVFFLGYQLDSVQPFDRTTFSTLLWDGTSVREVDSFLHITGQEDWKWGVNSLWSDGGTTYCAGNGVFHWTTQGWGRALSGTPVLRKIRGNASNNIFAVGSGNSIYHWNGINWMNLEAIHNENVNWNCAHVGRNEVFICGELQSKSIVLVGR